MSVSKGSNESEYKGFVEFIRRHSSDMLVAAIPTWGQVEWWRGKMIAEMDYEASETPGPGIWNEGYRYWWRLSNVKMLEKPYGVHGNVGMWRV